jgi:hypothetical protein
MPLLSRSLPAFASTSNGTQRPPSNAQDASNPSLWESTAVPAWLAYDISSVSDEAKRQALVAIYAEKASDYVSLGWAGYQQMPIDYVIEKNAGPGGSPPSDGWEVVASRTNNILADPQDIVGLEGANWVRVRVTRSTDPGTVALNVDVYSAPDGGTDDWLFLGDSITHMTFARAFHDLNQRVNNGDPSRWPAVIEAGIGGAGTQTALEVIDDRLAEFPGRYVVLGYGTNDHVQDFVMEALVQKVIAAGKTPVVPHVPWSDQKLDEGPQLNAIIDGLYQKYPQILRGPDLWTLLANTAYVSSGDVHPTEAGQEVILNGYAAVM